MNETSSEIAAKILLETESVQFNAKAPFTYTSGNKGPVYIDCRRPLSFPKERNQLMDLGARMLSQQIGLKNIDIIAGAETAGIPYGCMIAERLERPFIYVRKKPKDHGKMSQIEGYFDPDDTPNIVLCEDLQNYGHSKRVFVDALRQAGANISHFFVLFDYGIRADVTQENKNMGLTLHALCNWFDVLSVAKANKYFDEATLDSVEAYLKAPDQWAA
jgi:orotate phosphoribosyltransferase